MNFSSSSATADFSSNSPVPVCIVGIGGFAESHHKAIFDLEQKGVFKLVATCDPNHLSLGLQEIAAKMEFERRGVRVYADFDELIKRHEKETQLITLPVPIRFHAPMHAACVERGIACYLEKPPTLNPRELEEMIAVDEKAAKATQVGFNYIVESWRHKLKERLFAGEFGKLQRITFLGEWPRDAKYYSRAPWAGKLMGTDGTLILDSCFGNAMAHYIHNSLFFAGQDGVFSWTQPRQIRSELYRANSIQSFDTLFSEAQTESDVIIRIAMSHATSPENGSITRETLYCEKARIEITPHVGAKIFFNEEEKKETHEIGYNELVQANFLHYLAYLQGKAARPTTLLKDSRPFVSWNAMNFVAAGKITNIPKDHIKTITNPHTESPVQVIDGISDALTHFLNTGQMPSENAVSWAQVGGSAEVTPQNLEKLNDVVKSLV
ncbi:MAG: Gfo/Idh/MocA family protein [Chthoniobacterales bacterium]